MLLWQGNLTVDQDHVLKDVYLSTPPSFECQDNPSIFHQQHQLHLLAYVDPSRIPLHLAFGPSYVVNSKNNDSLRWLEANFSTGSVNHSGKGDQGVSTPPHEDDATAIQSSIGLLFRASYEGIEGAGDAPLDLGGAPRLTEVLFYAVSSTTWLGSSPYHEHNIIEEHESTGPILTIFALPLSSDLLYIPRTPAAEQSPTETSVPLQSTPTLDSKDRLNTLFDTAADRRKRARRKSGHAVSLAASAGAESTPKLQRLTASFDTKIKLEVDDETTPRTSRPPSRRSVISPLERADSQQNSSEDTSTEENKQLISRTVMAGMRMYGLQQSRKASASTSFSQAREAVPHEKDESAGNVVAKDKDAEFKAVYHQTHKGTLFAFRNATDAEVLSADAVREVVDRLLCVFCADPP